MPSLSVVLRTGEGKGTVFLMTCLHFVLLFSKTIFAICPCPLKVSVYLKQILRKRLKLQIVSCVSIAVFGRIKVKEVKILMKSNGDLQLFPCVSSCFCICRNSHKISSHENTAFQSPSPSFPVPIPCRNMHFQVVCPKNKVIFFSLITIQKFFIPV